jgi:hypothetical protein
MTILIVEKETSHELEVRPTRALVLYLILIEHTIARSNLCRLTS